MRAANSSKGLNTLAHNHGAYKKRQNNGPKGRYGEKPAQTPDFGIESSRFPRDHESDFLRRDRFLDLLVNLGSKAQADGPSRTAIRQAQGAKNRDIQRAFESLRVLLPEGKRSARANPPVTPHLKVVRSRGSAEFGHLGFIEFDFDLLPDSVRQNRRPCGLLKRGPHQSCP